MGVVVVTGVPGVGKSTVMAGASEADYGIVNFGDVPDFGSINEPLRHNDKIDKALRLVFGAKMGVAPDCSLAPGWHASAASSPLCGAGAGARRDGRAAAQTPPAASGPTPLTLIGPQGRLDSTFVCFYVASKQKRCCTSGPETVCEGLYYDV